MTCKLSRHACAAFALLGLLTFPCLAQDTGEGDVFDESGSEGAITGDGTAGGLFGGSLGGGLGSGVTTPPLTTPPISPGTGGTVGTGGGTVLSPRNSVSNLIEYNNAKEQTERFLFPTFSGSSTASAALEADPFRDAFLIPFIQSIFQELQAFIVQIVASSNLGNVLPPTTSSPA